MPLPPPVSQPILYLPLANEVSGKFFGLRHAALALRHAALALRHAALFILLVMLLGINSISRLGE